VKHSKIFISYAREDLSSVTRYYDPLLEAGFEPWMDIYDLLPGQDWELAIRQQIRESDYFLAFLSKRSIDKKGFVQNEIRLGLETMNLFPDHLIYFIPVRLEKIEIPIRLRHIQCLDCFQGDNVDSLVGSMKRIREKVRQRESPPNEPKIFLADSDSTVESLSIQLEHIETQRSVKLLAEGIADDQSTASGRKALTKDRLLYIISSLGEIRKVELLFLYESLLGKWINKFTAASAQTLVITYQLPTGDRKVHALDWSFEPMYELNKRFGLGNEKYLVRDVFIKAIAKLKHYERTEVFDGINLLDYTFIGSTA
jgi:hypothetical protein